VQQRHRQVELQRARQRRAAALEHIHYQATRGLPFERQTQQRW
jgi:hypothetical protein